MSAPNYKHIVEYDIESDKIVIYRVFDADDRHLYTEIPISDVEIDIRTLAGIGRILGEALIVDMPQLRDKFT